MAQTVGQGIVQAAALSLLATPALGQTAFVQPASISFAKSEAILGGAPSRLAAILGEQKAPTASPAQQTLLQPAALSIPKTSYADFRATPFRSVTTTGRPDVFGSVALTVRRTPLDAKWNRVARARIGGVAASYAEDLRSTDARERIEAVNRYINRRIQFVDDSQQYGREDLWTAAGETLRRGRGDCEDYAIAKLQMLRAAGIAERDLYLVIVKDLVRRADHAVLVVRADDRFLVLDNGTDIVADAETIRDYRPVMTFAATGAWIHGYRRPTAPIQVASVDLKPLAPAAAAASENGN